MGAFVGDGHMCAMYMINGFIGGVKQACKSRTKKHEEKNKKQEEKKKKRRKKGGQNSSFRPSFHPAMAFPSSHKEHL